MSPTKWRPFCLGLSVLNCLSYIEISLSDIVFLFLCFRFHKAGVWGHWTWTHESIFFIGNTVFIGTFHMRKNHTYLLTSTKEDTYLWNIYLRVIGSKWDKKEMETIFLCKWLGYHYSIYTVLYNLFQFLYYFSCPISTVWYHTMMI